MISHRQIRAARALLDWPTSHLAELTGLTINGLNKIERGHVRAQQSTLDTICAAFEGAGIEFLDNDGVRQRNDLLRVLEGDDAYLRMMDDVYYAIGPDSVVYFFCADDKSTKDGEIEAERRVRDKGARFKCLIREGSDYIRWTPDEYREMPAAAFNHDLQVIYGDCVAQLIDKGQKILIIRNASLATTERNKFDLIWNLMNPYEEKNHDV